MAVRDARDHAERVERAPAGADDVLELGDVDVAREEDAPL